jgi:hypothetical protein
MPNSKAFNRARIAYGLLCLIWVSATYFPQPSEASYIAGSSTPSGPAGGGLTGTYPNPLIAGVSGTGVIPFQTASTGILSSDTAWTFGVDPNGSVVATAGAKVATLASSNNLSWMSFISNNTWRGSFGAPSGAGLAIIDNGGVSIWQNTFGTSNSVFSGDLKVKSLSTGTNCSSAGGTCGSAAAGSVTIAAAGTTVTVSTTAVTANSQIFVMYDSSLGTKLSVTCNTTEPALYGVTARTAATSFVITATSPITNPACFSYFIVN